MRPEKRLDMWPGSSCEGDGWRRRGGKVVRVVGCKVLSLNGTWRALNTGLYERIALEHEETRFRRNQVKGSQKNTFRMAKIQRDRRATMRDVVAMLLSDGAAARDNLNHMLDDWSGTVRRHEEHVGPLLLREAPSEKMDSCVVVSERHIKTGDRKRHSQRRQRSGVRR